MQTVWFGLFSDAVTARGQKTVSDELALSPSTVNQVLRAGGNYGTGVADTARIEQRVMDTYGGWQCPFLSDGEPRQISAGQCRAKAHREPPTGSPRDLAHWRACQACPMRVRSAPPQARPVIPRKKKEVSDV